VHGTFDLELASGHTNGSALLSTPEPGVVSLLVTMLAGLGGLAGVLKRKLT